MHAATTAKHSLTVVWLKPHIGSEPDQLLHRRGKRLPTGGKGEPSDLFDSFSLISSSLRRLVVVVAVSIHKSLASLHPRALETLHPPFLPISWVRTGTRVILCIDYSVPDCLSNSPCSPLDHRLSAVIDS